MFQIKTIRDIIKFIHATEFSSELPPWLKKIKIQKNFDRQEDRELKINRRNSR